MQKKFVKAMGGAFITESTKHEAPNSKQIRNSKNKIEALPGRLAETLQTVRDAKSLRDAAKTRGLAASTIVKHLEELAEVGKLARADFAHIVSDLRAIDEIHKALAATSDDRLSPIFHALGGRYSFETIRLVRLMRSN